MQTRMASPHFSDRSNRGIDSLPQSLKKIIRRHLSGRFEVPVKYWLHQLKRDAEPEMALLPYLVGSGDRVLDIGGNRGTYAYRLNSLGAQVEIFEPNPVCLRVLSDWAANKPTISIHPVGLSADGGNAQLRIPVDEDGTEHDAAASVEGAHVQDGNFRSQDIELRTLDSFGFKNVALIKIDVEGHEYAVLAGAGAIISESRPTLIVEIEQRHLSRPITDIFDFIEAKGYRGFFLDGSQLFPLADFELARDQPVEQFGTPGIRYLNNFLFLHGALIDSGAYVRLLKKWPLA